MTSEILHHSRRLPFPARLRVVLFMEDQILRLGVQAIMSDLASRVDTYFAANEFDFLGKVREYPPDVAVLTASSRRLWQVVEGAAPAPRLLLVIEQHQT